jgi:hypothetical protein
MLRCYWIVCVAYMVCSQFYASLMVDLLLDISYFILLIILMIVREIFIYMYISLLAYKFHATFDVLYISENT